MFSRMAKTLLVLGSGMVLSGVVLDSRLPTVGAAVFAWVLVEWLLFHASVVLFDRCLRLERSFAGPTGLPTVWRDQQVTVRVRLANRSWFHFPHLEARDIVPPHFEVAPGSGPAGGGRWRLALGPREAREWSYDVVATRVGHARFPGVAVQATSFGGLFAADRFLDAPADLRVYPPLAGKKHLPALTKFYNQFRHHGVHVYRRGGTGSELLELRDYIAGDPPQAIAWRPSARREELVTRVFESEVPMRIHVFLDGSASMRVGTGETHLEVATEMLAEFARVALSNRDWVGLTLVDERREEVVRPARGRAQLYRILDLLARHGNLSSGHAIGDFEGLFRTVEAYCQVRFPQLWEKPFNRSGVGFFSVRVTLGSSHFTRRKRLATIVAAHLGESPRLIEACLSAPRVFADLLARFCLAEGLRLAKGFSEEVLDLGARCDGKLEVLERSLRYAIQRARDNELYVLLMDFAGLADRLGPILEALKLAQQKHHAIVAMSPWLSEYFQEVPGAAEASREGTRILAGPWGPAGGSASTELLERLTFQRYVRQQEEVRTRFLAAGLPFATVRSQEALPRLLSLVTRLRLNQGVMT
ncbi:MAG: DUF58 domain-containing protein [Planctomycetes bacterium]|nr:DUF58 domain-containing protein [Planctomycetota bacterium]